MPPLASQPVIADSCIHLGSFSKVGAPGLRLGWVRAPEALLPALAVAKQAADLHTPGFNQRIVHEIVKSGFLERHVPTIRTRYRAQRDAMQAAGLQPESAEVTLRADNMVAVGGDHAEQVSDLLEWLEELDDVQDVYSNAELPQ